MYVQQNCIEFIDHPKLLSGFSTLVSQNKHCPVKLRRKVVIDWRRLHF